MARPSVRSPRRAGRARAALAPIAAAGLALAMVIGWAPAAVGHAVVVSSDPADGATLVDPPSQIRLEFTEEISAVGGTFDLVASDGRQIAVDLESAGPGEGASLILRLPHLEQDRYRLRWSVLSSDDLHVSRGTLVFGVGTPAEASTATAEAGASPVEVGLRWIDLLAFSVLVGAATLLLVGLRPLEAAGDRTGAALAARTRTRLIRLGLIAAAAALVVGAARVVALSMATDAGVDPAQVAAVVSGSAFGRLWIGREIVLLLALAALFGASRTGGRAAVLILAASGFVIAAAILQAATGHLVARLGPFVAIPIGAVHILAAGVWVGGVVALALGVLPVARADEAGRRYGRRILARFGWIAVAGLVGLIVSGLLLMGNLVATLDALGGSAYGISLLVKIALVGGVAVLGFTNAVALHRPLALGLARPIPRRTRLWLSRRDVHRSVRAEAMGGLAVIGLAALLASSPPARGPAWDPPLVDGPMSPVIGSAADLLVSVDVRPNRPGPNFVALQVVDTRRPAPAPVGRVTLRLVGPDGRVTEPAVIPLGDGHFEARPTFPRDGPWRVVASISRAGLEDAVFETPWAVLPPGLASVERSTLVSRAPLEPFLTRFAAVLGAGAVIAGFVLIASRRLGRSRWSRSGPTSVSLPAGRSDG